MIKLKMSNHTPGPWKAQEDECYWGVYDKAKNCLAEAPEPDGGANIQLMALAPKLVAHLKTALEYLQHPAPQAKLNVFFKRVRPLLAQIEGEE